MFRRDVRHEKRQMRAADMVMAKLKRFSGLVEILQQLQGKAIQRQEDAVERGAWKIHQGGELGVRAMRMRALFHAGDVAIEIHRFAEIGDGEANMLEPWRHHGSVQLWRA